MNTALINTIRDIVKSGGEQHFTFINENGTVKIVKKQARTCRTLHDKHLSVLFDYYNTAFAKYPNENEFLDGLAKGSNLSVAELEEQINELFNKTLAENPELLI